METIEKEKTYEVRFLMNLFLNFESLNLRLKLIMMFGCLIPVVPARLSIDIAEVKIRLFYVKLKKVLKAL